MCDTGCNTLDEPGDITILLQQWNEGKEDALAPLFELVYPQLRAIASALFRNERPELILQPTSVVNELYLKLLRQNRLRLTDRAHFFNLSARLMRRVLVDQARMDGSKKRSGGVAVPLNDDLAWVNASSADILDLDRALEELQRLDDRKCRMLELRFFLGLTAEETGELVGASKATVDREMKFARGWLYDRLHQSGSNAL